MAKMTIGIRPTKTKGVALLKVRKPKKMTKMAKVPHTKPPCAKNQAREKSTNINFLGLETARWGGGFSTRRRGGRKVRALPRKLLFLGLRRGTWMSQEICRDVPDPWGCSKSLCKKKVCAHFSFPKKRRFRQPELWHGVPKYYFLSFRLGKTDERSLDQEGSKRCCACGYRPPSEHTTLKNTV